jgi:hypothetical protein
MLRAVLKRNCKESANATINKIFGKKGTLVEEDEIILIPDGEISDVEEVGEDDDVEPPAEIPEEIDTGNQPDTQRIFRWRKAPLEEVGDMPTWTPPEILNEESSPYRLFQKFFSRDILKHVAFETNRYSVQVSGKSIDVTPSELEQFFGILLYTTI